VRKWYIKPQVFVYGLLASRLTRMPRVQDVWSNLGLIKSDTALQTVRHRFNY